MSSSTDWSSADSARARRSVARLRKTNVPTSPNRIRAENASPAAPAATGRRERGARARPHGWGALRLGATAVRAAVRLWRAPDSAEARPMPVLAPEAIAFVWSAQPNTYLVTPTRDETDEDLPGFYRRLVIGWALLSTGGIRPITTDGVEDTDDRVLIGNGPIEGPLDAYPTIASFRSAMIEQKLAETD